MYKELESVEGNQREIEQNLEYIDAQQTELESSLQTFTQQLDTLLEKDVQKFYQLIRGQPADEDREKAYLLAETLNAKLDEMTSSLGIVIDATNSTKANRVDDSPLSSIVQVLNSHLTVLEWLERSTSELESKVETIRLKAASIKI